MLAEHLVQRIQGAGGETHTCIAAFGRGCCRAMSVIVVVSVSQNTRQIFYRVTWLTEPDLKYSLPGQSLLPLTADRIANFLPLRDILFGLSSSLPSPSLTARLATPNHCPPHRSSEQ